MFRISDPALHAFDKRQDPHALQSFMESYTTRATKEIEQLQSYEQIKGYRF